MEDIQWGRLLYQNKENTTLVYSGHYSSQPVIIKHQRFLTDTDFTRAWERAEVQSGLEHDGIVRILRYFGQGREVMVVMESMRTSLEEEIEVRRKRDYYWEEGEIWGFVWMIVHALAYAQERHVCHRNIQPDNLYLSTDNLLKVSNFNKARLHDITTSIHCTSTPYYSSPELKRLLLTTSDSECRNAYESDVYSLGLVVLHMIKLSQSMEFVRMQGEEVLQRDTERIVTDIPTSNAMKGLLMEMLKINGRMDFLSLRAYLVSLYSSPPPDSPEVDPQPSDFPTPTGEPDLDYLLLLLHDPNQLETALLLSFESDLKVTFTVSMQLECNNCCKKYVVDVRKAKNEESYLICGEKCRLEAVRVEN